MIVYYTFGNLILPMGDFSMLKELPEMYHHCKTYEDKDMTLLDFITDHLINIDGMFDHHDHGDEQKPHNPTDFNHSSFVLFFTSLDNLPILLEDFFNITIKLKSAFHVDLNILLSPHLQGILRPPIFE